MSNDEISTRIRLVREGLSMSQSSFSRELGIPRSTLVGYESGSTIPAEIISNISVKFGMAESWLLTGEGYAFKDKRNSTLNGMQVFPTKKRKSTLITTLDGWGDFESEPGVSPEENKNVANHDMPIIQGDVPRGLIIPLLDQAVSAGYGKELEDEGFPDRFITVPRDLARFKALKALPVKGDSMSPILHEGDLVVCDSGGWDGDGIYVIKTQESAYVKRVVMTSKGYTVISDNKAYPSYSESKEDVEIVGKVRCAVVRLK